MTGSNQIANNYLRQHGVDMKRSEQEQFNYAVTACSNGDRSACERRDNLIAVSQQPDQVIVNSCASRPSAECNTLIRDAAIAGNKTIFGSDGRAVVYPLGTSEIGSIGAHQLIDTSETNIDSFHQRIAKSTSEGLVLAGLAYSPSAIPASVEIGANLWTGYKAATATYSLAAAAGTGAVISGTTYTAGVGASAFKGWYYSGQEFKKTFEENFSYAGLGAAMAVGAASGAYGTAMFGWAGAANGIGNVATLPGAIIRVNGLAISQAAGRAAEGAVKTGGKK